MAQVGVADALAQTSPTAATFSEIEMLPRYKLVVEPPTASTISIPEDWPTYKPKSFATSGSMASSMSGLESEKTVARDMQVSLTDNLMKNRFSCRFYSPKEVEREVVEEIIDVARFAPSGNNIQPWEKVYCLTGQTLRAVTSEILSAFRASAPTMGSSDPTVPETGGSTPPAAATYKAQYNYYPPFDEMPATYLERRQSFGKELGAVIGLDRMDVEKRREVASKNFEFYRAPVAMVFTINKGLTQGSWLDLGFFLQSINIAARARGLETVAQESVSKYQAIFRKHLPISENEIVVVGMAMGYPDEELAKRYAMPRSRRSVDDIITFFG